ncbi:cytochrome P450 71A1-like isoform X1 [Aegilops tauschii subsp. strangulata]|uniref:cytochrome P450 71A1-like isoform X1 n=1 Tax=Aegilops tauschii subsp. strangulata TaxID=200361 RepID=UPI001ABCAEC2|nr:cytochrome P450 71A1-like isoform X1 [Aegilops tauschii subsp. strangulata]
MEDAILLFLLPVATTMSILLLLRAARSNPQKRPHRSKLATVPPPSPWRLPLVGNLHQLAGGRLPHRALAALAAAHGPVMLLRLGQVPAVVLSSPDAAREVMLAQDHVFATRPSLAIPSKLFYGCTDVAFAPHGPYWLRARKTCVLHLLSPARVRAYRAVREEEVGALLDKVRRQARVVPLSELLAGFAKDVIGRIVFGASAATRADGWGAKVDALLEEGNALLGTFHVGDYFPSLAWLGALDGTDAKVGKAFDRIDAVLEEIVDAAERRMGGVHGGEALGRHDSTFVDVLLSLGNNTSGAGSAATEKTAARRFTRDNVKGLLAFWPGTQNLFGAGADSTIIVLEWAMAELLRNKEAMEKLQHELRSRSVSTNSDMITEEDLQGMVYLKAVMKETMRLHPPGPLLIPREAMEPTTIQQYDVPSKTMVIVNAWAIGRDPDSWESPEEFRPERFLGAGGEVDFRGRHFQLVPFGSGRRVCPGINFTMSIMEIAIANLLGQFNWALPEGATEEVVDMEEAPGITSRKRVPLHVHATPRASCSRYV